MVFSFANGTWSVIRLAGVGGRRQIDASLSRLLRHRQGQVGSRLGLLESE